MMTAIDFVHRGVRRLQRELPNSVFIFLLSFSALQLLQGVPGRAYPYVVILSAAILLLRFSFWVTNDRRVELESLRREIEITESENPYRDRPGYEGIKAYDVILKDWDDLTDAEKDVDFWMRTKELQRHLFECGDHVALKNLRRRYEEVREEESVFERRAKQNKEGRSV